MDQLEGPQQNLCQRLYTIYCKEGEEKIDVDSFFACLCCIGQDLTGPEQQAILDKYDKDGDAQIDLEELAAMLKDGFDAQSTMVNAMQLELQTLFGEDGTVDEDINVESFISKLQEAAGSDAMSKDELEEIFKDMDIDASGTLNMSELSRAMYGNAFLVDEAELENKIEAEEQTQADNDQGNNDEQGEDEQ